MVYLFFTLYGKEIGNFIKQLLKGKDYVVQMTNTQRALIEQMGELGNATHSTVGDVEFLGIALKKWENNENGIRGSVRNSKALVEKIQRCVRRLLWESG